MKYLHTTLTTIITCALVFIVTASPANAGVIVQDWSPFEFIVPDDSDCSGQPGLAQGMVHTTVATMPRGGFNIHVNARGTWTGLDTGVEAKWLDNISDVLPILGENFVYTYQQSLRILGGPGGSFFLRYKFHLVEIGGEVRSYIDSLTIECTV